MKINDLRPGYGIKMDGKVFVVVSVEHRTPGNLRAFIQLTYKNVQTGQTLDKRFNPAEEVDVIDLDRRTMEYLYSDNTGATFMDTETYDQATIPPAVLGDALLYLRPNAQTVVLFHGTSALLVELPSSVELVVKDTPPGIKGATATNQLKEATLETGLATRVPAFIAIGETIKVSTADGSYLSRA
ncbi:MAG: elongation factor P [Pyrinomonadaceae bacterium]|nr:elongation factor P [Phycisphaerales bacterium]